MHAWWRFFVMTANQPRLDLDTRNPSALTLPPGLSLLLLNPPPRPPPPPRSVGVGFYFPNARSSSACCTLRSRCTRSRGTPTETSRQSSGPGWTNSCGTCRRCGLSASRLSSPLWKRCGDVRVTCGEIEVAWVETWLAEVLGCGGCASRGM